MGLCFWRDERLSRYLDGELSVKDHREVQEHVRRCGRCSRRMNELRAVDEAVALLETPLRRTAPPSRLALSIAVAAALLASLAANLFLHPEKPAARASLGVPAPPSDTLSTLYARLSGPAPGGR